MKKLLSLLLAVVMVATMLAACGSTESSTEATEAATEGATEAAATSETTAETEATELSGEITFWHSFTQGARMEAVQAAADKFMEMYPNVTITIETMSWGDFNTKWNAGLTTGDLPDISTAQGPGEVVEMLNADVLASVDEIVDDIGRDRFSSNALSDMSVDDVTYAIPYYSHAQVMWYRQDYLDAAELEVPTTWAEFAEVAKALTKDGVYGAAFSCSTNDLLCTRYLNYYVRSAGGSLLNDDLTANLTSDIAIEGIKFWLDIYESCSPAETINYTINDHATLFYQGTTAFDFNSGFMISGVQANTPEAVQYVKCAPLPVMNEGDETYSAENSHIPLVVWKNSENYDVCKAFIEFLYEDENYIEFIHSVPVGMLPALSDIATNEDYLSDETIQQFADSVEIIQTAVDEGHAIGFEHGPSAQASYLTSQGVIEEMFQDIITNGTDVETAAKAAEDKLNDIFETMIVG